MKIVMGLAAATALFANVACTEPASERASGDSVVRKDEVAVYEAVLASWLGKEPGPQLIDQNLSDAPSSADPEFKDCAEGLPFPAKGSGTEAAKSLAAVRFSRNGLQLIDGRQWKPADPSASMAQGQFVDSAVREGPAKSLISFSQIAFSSDRKNALVKFSMVCGGLCGSGSTMLLHRTSAGWAIRKRCGDWIS